MAVMTPRAGVRAAAVAAVVLTAGVCLPAQAPAPAPASGPAPAAARAQAPAIPVGKLLLIDGERLADVRARLGRGDAALTPALAALEQDAAKALAMRPASVMDKTVTPPSGDKHDYMSQAPYWWPDPAKADGKPYIRRDGERNPEINRISDHDRLGQLTGTVSTLGQAYYLTGREEYAAHAARLTRVWFLDAATRMHPHLRFGQGIPGITDGRGIGIIETRGLPNLLDGITLIAGSSSWAAADQKGLEAWMREYVAWLVDSLHGREEAKNGNNHETWYDVQVASLALFTGQPDLARRTLARSRDRIGTQIQPDGRMPRELERTRAWDYSVFNLTAFFCLARLGARPDIGIDLWQARTPDGRSLRQALDFLVPYASRERAWPHAQITGFSPINLQEPLRRAAAAWNEPKYAALARQLGGASTGGGNARLDLAVP